MRKLLFRTVVLVAIAGAPALAIAQAADSDARQTARAADTQDKSDWGWVGLLGLAGLLGLKRRDRDEAVNSNRAAAR